MKGHPGEIARLNRYRQAIDAIIAMGVQILTSSAQHVVGAGANSQQHGLLSNDALIVTLMQANSLLHLASHDADFDRVPGIVRYEP